MAEFNKTYIVIANSEKGYSTSTTDKGNYYNNVFVGTNYGISAKTLATYLGRTPTESDMRNLPQSTAIEILRTRYWQSAFDKLANQSIANVIVDGNVNHGVTGMKAILQKALLNFNKSVLLADLYTDKGVSILNSLNEEKLFNAIKLERKTAYESLNDPNNINGWYKRLTSLHFAPSNTNIIKKVIKKVVKNDNMIIPTIIIITPFIVLPIVLGGFWAYKKYIKKT
jgi:lysozyme family protein